MGKGGYMLEEGLWRMSHLVSGPAALALACSALGNALMRHVAQLQE